MLSDAMHRWRGREKPSWQWTLKQRRRAPSTESLRMSCALAWMLRAVPQRGCWECYRYMLTLQQSQVLNAKLCVPVLRSMQNAM